MATLVLGGARSGKSRYAQNLAESLSPKRVFIATAEALDEEMKDRIARHVAERGASWTTIEAPVKISTHMLAMASDDCVILVDCLTLWLSNLMRAALDVESKTEELVESLSSTTAPVILVSNEVGMGIVPETPLGRQFRDAQGRLNQAMAAACETVEFIAAGLPLRLKG